MRIGRHMPTHSNAVKAAQIAHDLGCNAIQIFASNPTAWKPPIDHPDKYAAFVQAAQDNDLAPVVIHAPYLINLASPEPFIWDKSRALLAWTLQRAIPLGARYVVFHTGSHKGTSIEEGIQRIIDGIGLILLETPSEVMLLLENDVGAGNSLGARFETLAAILDALPAYRDRLGVCLDTAHLWGAGHDLSTAESTQEIIQQFDGIIGLNRLHVLHLNDTKMALGSHRDIHARVGEGIIPTESLRALLTDPRLSHVAVILETPIQTDEQDKEDWDHDREHMERVKKLFGVSPDKEEEV